MPKKPVHWYEPLRALKSKGSSTENVGGLAGIAAAREQHQGQFFTPDDVVRFVWGLLQPSMDVGVKDSLNRFTIFDNSFGSGRLLQFADPGVHTLVGIEADADLAAHVQKAVSDAGFACNLETGSMTEFRPKEAEYNIGIINPPFSLHLDGPEVYPYHFNSHGRYGEKSSTLSHRYAIAQAIQCCQVVAAIVPRGFVDEIKADRFFYYRMAGIYHLPKGAFLSEGADWPISVVLFGYPARTYRYADDRLHPNAPEVHVEPGQAIAGPLLCATNHSFRKELERLPRYDRDQGEPFTKMPVTGSKRVRICHNGRKVLLGFDCALAQIRVLNRIHRGDYNDTRPSYSHDRIPVGLRSAGQGQLDLEAYLIQDDPVAAWKKFLASIRSWGYEPAVYPGIENYLRRRVRRDKLIRTPFRRVVNMGKDRGLMHWLDGKDNIRWVCTKECRVQASMYDAHKSVPVGTKVLAEVIGTKWKFTLKAKKSKESGWLIGGDQEVWLDQSVMLEHFKPVDFVERDGWVVIHEGLAASHPEQFDAMMTRARKLGLDKWCTWDYQLFDLVELAMKRGRSILAWEMGLGKARELLALCMLGGDRNAVCVEAHLVEEMVQECRVLGIPESQFQVIELPANLPKSALRKINILSYNKAKGQAPAKDATKLVGKKMTFGKRLRGMFHTVACDEGHLLRNLTTDQSVAIMAIKGKSRYIASGTPIANYCRDMLPILQWVAGAGNAVMPYGRTPGKVNKSSEWGRCDHFFLTKETLTDASPALRGIDVFRTQFSVFEWVTNEFAEDMVEGAKREVPKIADVIGFRRLIAPFVKRRVMEEPEVARYVSIPKPVIRVETLDWDLDHLIHYVRVAREFADWYRKMSESEKSRNLVMILAKIQAIITACNFPQLGSLNGAYTRLTSKQKFALDLIEERVKAGHKTMFCCQSPGVCNLIADEAKKRGIDSVIFHGGITVAKRNKTLYRDFRDGKVPLLIATKGCMQTGYNLPQVSAMIMYDRFWTPKVEHQTMARALRPQQKQTVLIDFLHLNASMDEYQAQMSDMKAASMRAGLDYGADDEDDKDFKHMDHILGQFVEELERRLGTSMDALITKKKQGRA